MKRNLLLSLLARTIALSSVTSAQPELDTSFNSTGKAVLGAGEPRGMAEDVLVLPDDSIVIVSGCVEKFSIMHPFCLGRFTAAGQSTGVTRTNVPGSLQRGEATGIALQADGKLVVAGYAEFPGPVEKAVIARYNSAGGGLDDTFGTGGLVITDVSDTMDDRANELAIQPDGKIVVVGYSYIPQTGIRDKFVARYHPNGTLDANFGNGGIVRTFIKGISSAGESISLLPDGKILTGGVLFSDSPSDGYLLARLNADGSPDNTWDGDGIRIIYYPSSGSDRAGIRSLSVQPNGRVVALGHGNSLYRLLSDGTLDTSFDTDGSRDALPGGSTPYDFVLSPDGRITVVGHNSYQPVSFQVSLFRISRYLPNGASDPTFSEDGFLEIDVVDVWTDAARAVALDSQGRTVVAGSSSTQMRFAPWIFPYYSVVRLVAPPAPANVGITGRVLRSDGRPVNNTFLTLEGPGGETSIALTNPFGYYRFANVATGQNYTISARAKGHSFNPRQIFVGSEITGLDFVSSSPQERLR